MKKRRPGSQRAASPAGTGSPPQATVRQPGTSAGFSVASSVGVMKPQSTSCSTTNRRSRSGSARSAEPASCTEPPWASGTKTSMVNASKPGEEMPSARVPGPTPRRAAKPVTNATTLRWLVSTPFGRPVEPDV